MPTTPPKKPETKSAKDFLAEQQAKSAAAKPKEPEPVKPKAEEGEETEDKAEEPPVYTATMDKPRTV